MTKQTIISIVSAIVAVVAVVTGLFISHSIGGNGSTPGLGAAGNLLAENYIPYVLYNQGYNSAKSIKTTGDLTVGSSGSVTTQEQFGTCSLTADISLTATSTQNYDCPVTGVQSGDKVFVTLAATTTPGEPSFVVVGAQASTTSGFITVTIFNASSTSFVPSAKGFGSTTAYRVLR